MTSQNKSLISIMKRSPVYMGLTVALSVASVLFYFVPYLSIYRIVGILIDNYYSLGDSEIQEIGNLGLLAIVGSSLNVASYFAALSFSHIGSFEICYRLRLGLAKNILQMPYGKQLEVGNSRLINIMDDSANEVQKYFSHEIVEVIIAYLYPTILVLFLFYIDVTLAIAVLFGIGVNYYINTKSYSFAKGGVDKMMEIYLTALDELNLATTEFVRGASILRVFGRDNFVYKKLNEKIKAYTGACVPYTLVWEKYNCVFCSGISNVYLFIFPPLIYFVSKFGYSYELAVKVISFLILIPSLKGLIPKSDELGSHRVKAEVALGRIDEIESLGELKSTEKEVEFSNGNIEFKNVSFKYSSERENALNGISFTAKRGEKTVIVGPSGSGKSTVAYLIAGFWNPDSGKVTIDDKDIAEIGTQNLMKNISLVFQDTYLFHQSIYDNIVGGCLSVSMEDVVACAKKARCHDFIMSLPNGYNTIIGDDSVRFSGGERQKISLARALLKNAPIIILDEPTSSVDAESEYEILEAIDELAKDKTVVMIAHRMSSAVDADKVVLLQDGNLLDYGSHAELLENNELYAYMWSLYNKNIEWKI